MDSKHLLIVLFILAGTWWFTSKKRHGIPQGLKLPPGPPGLSLLGNIFDMPRDHAWLTYAEWARKYGDLVFVKVLGMSILFVNSEKMGQEIFERRSNLYSDRLETTVTHKLLNFDWAFALQTYGTRWRRHRRLFLENIRAKQAVKYRPTQIKRCQEFLRNFLNAQHDYQGYCKHIRHAIGAIIMEITYGIDVQPKDDTYIKMAEIAMQATDEAAIFGSFMVDFFPFIKYIPEWVPGGGFQKKIRIWHEAIYGILIKPYEQAKASIESCEDKPSMYTELRQRLESRRSELPPDEEEIVRNVLGVTIIGGADTTVTALESFLLAMVCNPDVQEKGHEEIARVVGFDRLVNFSDYERLPYINALVKETLRWHPLLPVGFPHRLIEDDILGEYFIPKGTLVFGNTWYMCHKESLFGPDTWKFQPERFLLPNIRYPTMAFGYGRRICPGRHMAEDTLFIFIASILQVYSLRPGFDDNGKEITLTPDFTDGTFSRPLPFSCRITPRPQSVLHLLEDSV